MYGSSAVIRLSVHNYVMISITYAIYIDLVAFMYMHYS